MTMIGTQPFVTATAYEIGRGCPIGHEVALCIGLARYFPELPAHEALDELFRGLADRFVEAKP